MAEYKGLPPPGEPVSDGGIISLPQMTTLIAHIPLTIPSVIIEETALTTAYTPDQQAVAAANDIDLERVSAGRTKPSDRKVGKNPYSVAELKDIAKRIGIRTAQTKAQLVEAIRAKFAS